MGETERRGGFKSLLASNLAPENLIEFIDEDQPNPERLDAIFEEISKSGCRTLVVCYFSGHGCINVKDKSTCIVMPYLDEDRKVKIYPLQKCL